jgi:SAM-dependent methyltransferase
MSKLSPDEALRILNLNSGFSKPHTWIDYAISHDFKLVGSKRISSCVDCSSTDLKEVGSYIYYSSLIKLMRCGSCGLVGVDTLIDPDVLQSHFESAYKSEDYFITERKPIFDQISNLVLENCKSNSSILDVGGAKGHLLSVIREKMPEAKLTLNDLSVSACEYAEEKYKLRVISGSACGITSEAFDAILLVDVLYYETDLNKLWSHLSHLLRPGGFCLIRLPNRHFLIRLNGLLGKLRALLRGQPGSTSIPSYNPEHLYVFSQPYLKKRLLGLGFKEVKFIPAKQLKRIGFKGILASLAWILSQVVFKVSGGNLVITPSMIVTAKR